MRAPERARPRALNDAFTEEAPMRSGRIAKIVVFAALAVSLVASAYAAPSGEPIKIGAIFAVTGPAAYLGAPEEKTARMVVDGINKSGGLLGRPVQLVVKDSMY